MKTKILKYNLIPMLIFYIISMLYNIGQFLNSIMMETKFQSGDYPYKSSDMNGRFFTELYGEEMTLGYMMWAFIILAAITVITLLFYRKKLSKISFVLLSLLIIPTIFIGMVFVSENIILLTVGLAIEATYLISTIIFIVKDFINFPIEIDK